MLYLIMYEDKTTCTVLYQHPITGKSIRLDFDKESEPIKSIKSDDDYILYILNQIRLITDKTDFKIARKLYYNTDIYTEPFTENARYLDFFDKDDGCVRMFVHQTISIEKRA